MHHALIALHREVRWLERSRRLLAGEFSREEISLGDFHHSMQALERDLSETLEAREVIRQCIE